MVGSGALGQNSPTVAFNGTNYLAAWSDFRNGMSDICAARVAPSCAVLDPAGLRLTSAAGDQGRPSSPGRVMTT